MNHIQRLPSSSTGKIPFTSSSNTVIASEPENAAKKVKQTLIVPLNGKPIKKASWGYLNPWCCSIKMLFSI